MSFLALKPKIHRQTPREREVTTALEKFDYRHNVLNPEKHSELSKEITKAMLSEIVLPRGRGPEFRPSSFPSCPVLNWMRLYRFKSLGHNENHHYFGMEYYTSVGTIVHEKIQYFMGWTGKVWGHWKCINHTCKEGIKAADLRDAAGKVIREGKPTRKHSFDNICPCCKEPMLYIEFTIKYKGVTGHIDGIMRLDNGKWVIFDYKTTSLKKAVAGNLPEKKHLTQLPFYTYVMEKKYAKKYGMKISEFSLIYIPRDNPFQFYEYREKWTDKWRTRCSNMYKREKANWDAIHQDLEDDTFTNVVSHKPCSCTSDYKSKMMGFDECIMFDVCFSAKKLKSRLTTWKRVHDSEKLIPRLMPFDKALAVVSDYEYKKKKKAGIDPDKDIKRVKI